MAILISIEGGDYVGKTSFLIPALEMALTEGKIPTMVGREPGGSPKAERMRELIFKKKSEGASALELAILFNQSRRAHLEDVLVPTLGRDREKNVVALLDRYLDSTRVYQGLEGGVPMEKLVELEGQYVGNWFPDLTIVLYITQKYFNQVFSYRRSLDPSQHGTARDSTSWDSQSIETHKKRQAYFMQLADIAHDLGEERQFLFVDVLADPREILINCIKKIGPMILDTGSHIHTKSMTIDDLIQAAENVCKKGGLLSVIRAWKKQKTALRL